MDDLREDMLSDDITKKLVLHKNKEMSEIFQSELTKHDNKTKIIEQNLLAQENIIRAMTEINAKYAPTRREVANLIEARKEKIQSLMDSFQAYENLLLKAKKAVDFYEQLNTNIQDLAKKVEKTMLDNEKEKDATIAKLTSTPKGNLKIFILTHLILIIFNNLFSTIFSFNSNVPLSQTYIKRLFECWWSQTKSRICTLCSTNINESSRISNNNTRL